jgi:hypothetical protein
MTNINRMVIGGFCLLIVLASACNGEPHDGYYDRDHHRWFHEHRWHDCEEHDAHCG